MATDIAPGAAGVKETALNRALWNRTNRIVKSRVTALPGGATDGDMYIVPHGAGAHPDEVAFRSEGAWLYLTPTEGWGIAYVLDSNEFVYFDGSVWQVIAAGIPFGYLDTDGTLAANSDVKVASQKAVKTYVDSAMAAIGNGGKVRVATTANITIATALNNGDSLDGVTLATDDMVLVKDQSAPEQNGIYVVGASPARATAYDTYNEYPGSIIIVEEGTTNADTLWLCTSNKGGTLNTTALAFTQMILTGTVPSTRTITAGVGLTGGGDLSANRTISADIGKQTIWVPAGAMVPRTTNGAASGTAEMTTNKNMVATLDFDASTQEFAQFDIRMPKSWNESTVTFIPVWSHAATTTNFGVVWGLDAVAISDNETLDVAFGTAQTSTDTGGTTNQAYQGPESSAITISGSPAVGDLVQFRIHRNPSDGSDTMAIDARLHGIVLLYTIDALKDD